MDMVYCFQRYAAAVEARVVRSACVVIHAAQDLKDDQFEDDARDKNLKQQAEQKQTYLIVVTYSWLAFIVFLELDPRGEHSRTMLVQNTATE